MKKFLAAVLAVLICLILAACFAVPAEANNTAEYTMELITRFADRDIDILREPVTDVLYLVYDEMNSGGITAMLDPETGLPMTYTKYLEQYSEMFQEDGT